MTNIYELLIKLREYPETDINVLLRRYSDDGKHELIFRYLEDVELFLVRNPKLRTAEVVTRTQLFNWHKNDLFVADFPQVKFIKKEDDSNISNLQIIK